MSPTNISREERREVNEQGGRIPRGEDSGDGSRPSILFYCFVLFISER